MTLENIKMGKTLHFRIDDESVEIIKNLTKSLACSKGELTRRALRLFEQIYTECRNGNDVIIRDNKTNKAKGIFLV